MKRKSLTAQINETLGAFFRDYRVDQEDKGQFVPNHEMGDGDLSSTPIKGGSIITFDNPVDNPFPELRYYCRVGGGYRGFKHRQNAVNFERQPL